LQKGDHFSESMMDSEPQPTDSASPPQHRPWRTALWSMIFCGLLFEIFYNACNLYTATRSDVGSFSFSWESKIPFIPAMIVPYWTLNLFFITSFFVCTTLTELTILRRRVATAILTACACFLLFPLTLTFPRPQVNGFFGFLFDALRSFDQPHNLAPSLHVGLRTLLWPVFIPRTRGILNLFLRVWFLLIGVSTLFTYQHQVMDVVTGWVLALFCMHLIAEPDPEVDRVIKMRNARVGIYYQLGAIFLLTLTITTWPWGALLLWPTVALQIVAFGYFAFGAIVFRKLRGRLAFSTRVLLAPVLFGHFLSLAYYRRQCRAWDKVVDGVWIGRRLNASESQRALAAGVTAVLDLSAEFSEVEPFLHARYLAIPVLDLTAPTNSQLQRAVDFIMTERERGVVYVHCKIGYSRSAAAVGAFLLDSDRADNVEDAIAQLHAVRPSIIVRPEIRRALLDYLESLKCNPTASTRH
jgi:protein-tyrosine phosphatase